MKLKDLPVLLLDAQTTGMRPPSGRLLELAWAVVRAADEEIKVEAHLIQLPAGEKIPHRVSEITGLTDQDMATAKAPAEVLARLREGAPEFAVIHYAQFEKPFLADLYGQSPPFEIFCSHQLTKRLFPNLPSQNIRGTAGFFGSPVGTLKRAGEHVRATFDIWRGICGELEKRGLGDVADLKALLADKKKIEKGRYEYRLPSEKRLGLPDAPGIYRMIAKTGEVLYVGKATSLKSRVNSYFRGKAGRDKRKLEMMAQVWDLEVTECRSALEAALLEADEIKRLNPPYNVVMKKGKRHLVFYARDFSSSARSQSPAHPQGPFRNTNWIEPLRALTKGLYAQVFWEPMEAEQVARAFHLFCLKWELDPNEPHSVRRLLALGLGRLRRLEVAEDVDEAGAEEEIAESPEYTDEDVVGKLERLLARAGHEHWRARLLTKMLNTRVTYVHKGQNCELNFCNGLRRDPGPSDGIAKPWHDLGVETFDRMSVLLSELEKYEHHIEWTGREA